MNYASSKGPELLDDLENRLMILLERHGLEKKRAAGMALRVTSEMAAAWGGQNIYFPLGQARMVKERDLQILKEFKGDNHTELAHKYQVTVPHIYRIIKNCKDKQRGKNTGR